MASENVDLVRSIYASWERADFSDTKWAHPEIEYVMADGPSPGRWTGLTGRAAGTRETLSAWEEWRFEVDDYRELDDQRVLALYRLTGRGRTSGLELGQLQARGANVFHIHDDKVTRLVSYWDRERAFADVGLSPEVDS